MNNYMLLFRGGNPRNMDFSPEQFQQHMMEWGAWVQGLHEAGVFKAGESLQPDKIRIIDPKMQVTDGPFTEAKELVGGFVIIAANDLDTATEIAKGCPVLKTEGTVEVRLLFPSPAG